MKSSSYSGTSSLRGATVIRKVPVTDKPVDNSRQSVVIIDYIYSVILSKLLLQLFYTSVVNYLNYC